jgi:hypothetical protein
MTTDRIIETIINTKDIHHRSYIGGMARLAQLGETHSIQEVRRWWVSQGGTVDPEPKVVIERSGQCRYCGNCDECCVCD